MDPAIVYMQEVYAYVIAHKIKRDKWSLIQSAAWWLSETNWDTDRAIADLDASLQEFRKEKNWTEDKTKRHIRVRSILCELREGCGGWRKV